MGEQDVEMGAAMVQRLQKLQKQATAADGWNHPHLMALDVNIAILLAKNHYLTAVEKTTLADQFVAVSN